MIGPFDFIMNGRVLSRVNNATSASYFAEYLAKFPPRLPSCENGCSCCKQHKMYILAYLQELCLSNSNENPQSTKKNKRKKKKKKAKQSMPTAEEDQPHMDTDNSRSARLSPIPVPLPASSSDDESNWNEVTAKGRKKKPLTPQSIQRQRSQPTYAAEKPTQHKSASINKTLSPQPTGPSSNPPTRSEENVIIVYGVTEAETDSADEKREHDYGILRGCVSLIPEEGASISVIDAFRLGSSPQNDNPRPLKVVLKSKQERDIFLKHKESIKSYMPGLDFHRHYTKTEREKHRQLKKIRDRRLQRGDNVVIRNGRVIRLRPPPVVMTCSQISSQSQVPPQIQTTDQIQAPNQLQPEHPPQFQMEIQPQISSQSQPIIQIQNPEPHTSTQAQASITPPKVQNLL